MPFFDIYECLCMSVLCSRPNLSTKVRCLQALMHSPSLNTTLTLGATQLIRVATGENYPLANTNVTSMTPTPPARARARAKLTQLRKKNEPASDLESESPEEAKGGDAGGHVWWWW